MKPRNDGMNSNQAGFIVVHVLVVLVLIVQEGHGQACIPVEAEVRMNYTHSPGSYDPNKMNRTECKKLCGADSYQHSATQGGRYCFCSLTPPDQSKAVAEATYCTSPCSGDSSEKCGGPGYLTTVTSAVKLEKLKIRSNFSGIWPVAADVYYGYEVAKGASVTFQFDFGDDAGSTSICRSGGFVPSVPTSTNFLSHVYPVPGTYTVIAVATSPLVPSLTEAQGTVIGWAVNKIKLLCPEAAAKSNNPADRSLEVACSVDVYSGTNMRLVVNFGNGRTENFSIADPLITVAGPGVQQHGPCGACTGNKLYVMPASSIQEDGHIEGWNYNLQTAGQLEALLLRPLCTTPTDIYCYDTQKCQKVCETTCASGQAYCAAKGVCSSTPSCSSSQRYKTSSFNFDYKVMYKTTFTGKLGFNYENLRADIANGWEVKRGDIIAVATPTGQAVMGCRPYRTNEPKDLELPYSALSTGSTVTKASLSSAHGQKLMFRAIVCTKSRVMVYNHYTTTGIFNVSALVYNEPESKLGGSATDYRNISIQTPINQSVPIVPAVVGLAVSEGYEAAEHEGEGAGTKYIWYYGDGNNATLTDRRGLYTWTSLGAKNVCLIIENAVSRKENCTIAIVKEPMGAINVSTDTTEFNQPTSLHVNISKGTNYSCRVDYGDGNITIYKSTDLPVGGATLKHTYKTPNKYKIKVNCSNGYGGKQPTYESDVEVVEKCTKLEFVNPGCKKGQPATVQLKVDVQNGYGLRYSCIPNNPFGKGVLDFSKCNDKNTCTSQQYLGVTASDAPKNLTCYAKSKMCSVSKSVKYTIDEPLTNPNVVVKPGCSLGAKLATVDEVQIMTNGCVAFIGSIASGTNVYLKCDYGDNNTYHGAWSKVNDRCNYTYPTAGVFKAKIKIGNGASSKVFPYTIKVFDAIRVKCLPSTIQDVGLIQVPQRSEAGYKPVLTTVTVDCGGGPTVTQTYTYTSQLFTCEYRKAGNYTIATTFSSPAEPTKKVTCSVEVVEMIGNTAAYLVPEHPKFGDNVTLLIKCDKGSGITVTATFDTANPGATTITKPYNASANATAVMSFLYNKVGTYVANITISNKFGSVSHVKTVHAEHPVIGGDYNFTSNAPVYLPNTTVDFTFEYKRSGANDPSNPNYKIIYGPHDGEENFTLPHGPAQSNLQKKFKKNYTLPGCRDAKVVIWNHASKVIVTANGNVLGSASPIDIDIGFLPSLPLNGNITRGVGPNFDVFPSNRALKIEIKPRINDTIKYYEVVAASASYVWVCNNTDYKPGEPVDYKIDGAGVYNVCITAHREKNLGSSTNCTTVTMADPVDGITINDEGKTVKPGTPKAFNVGFQKIGTNSCVAIDYGDNSTVELYGTPQSCNDSAILKKLGNPKNPVYKGPVTGKALAVTHTYSKEGSYAMRVIGANAIGAKEEKLDFSIANDSSCQRPNVRMKRAGLTMENPTKFRIYKRNMLETLLDVVCPGKPQNNKEWTAERVDVYGKPIQTMAFPKGVKGMNSSNLVMPPYTMPVGLYKLTFCAKMNGSSDIKKRKLKTCVSAYAMFERGNIVAQLLSTTPSVISSPQGKSFQTDPEKYSRDEDLDPNVPQGIEEFIYCARRDNETLDEKVLISPTDDGNSNGGCWGNGTGCMKFPTKKGSLTFPLNRMMENETCIISLIAKKGNRVGRTSLRVNISPSTAPAIRIKCDAPNICRFVGDKTLLTRVSCLQPLKAECTDNCPTAIELAENATVFFEWEIQVYEPHPNQKFGWNNITHDDRYMNGKYSQVYILKPAMFKVHNSKLYKAKCTMTYNGVAHAEMEFIVNECPTIKKCSITPHSGKIDDNFTVTAEGLDDDQEVKRVEILVDGALEAPPEETSAPDGKFSKRMKFKSHANEAVTVRVVDNDLAFSECFAGNISVGTTVTGAGDLIGTLDDIDKINEVEDNTQMVEKVRQMSSVVGSIGGITKKFEEAEVNGVELSKEEQDIRTAGTKVIGAMLYTMKKCEMDPREKVENFISVMNPHLHDHSIMAAAKDFLNDTLGNVLEEEDMSMEDKAVVLGKMMCGLNAISSGLKTNKGNPTEYTKERAIKKAKAPSAIVPGQRYDGRRDSEKRVTERKTRDKLCDEETDEFDPFMADIKKKLIKAIVKCLPPGGPPLKTKTKTGSLECLKDTANNIGRRKYGDEDAEADVPPFCDCNPKQCKGNKVVSVMVVKSKPRAFVNKGKMHPHSSCAVLDITNYDEDGNKLETPKMKKPLTYGLKLTLKKYEKYADVKYQDMEHNDPYTSISAHLELEGQENGVLFIRLVPSPMDFSKCYMVFLAVDRHVNLTEGYYNYTTVIPRTEGSGPNLFKCCLKNKPMTAQEQAKCKSNKLDPLEYKVDDPDSASDPYTFSVPTSMIEGAANKTILFMGIREMDAEDKENINDTKAMAGQPAPDRWKHGNITQNFSVSSYEQHCMYYKEKAQIWSTSGCQVVPETTSRSRISCSCNHLTAFAGGWVVVPNKIDFNYVFQNLDPLKNPSVYATLLTIIVIYIIAAIVCRRADKKDVERSAVFPLVDNDPNDKYMYELIVASGMSKGAGTHSKVFFILSGEQDETDVRVLHDRERGNKTVLDRGNIDSFLLTVPRPLGPMNYVRIWHDNSGKGKFASWYLKYFLVNDLQTKKKYQFICNRWFAVEEDDGQVDRLIPVAGKEQMVEFGHLFSQTTRKNLGDEHLWFSLVARPPRSRFTRLQRCSCCLQLLVLTMLANAMFYGLTPEKPNPNALEIGPFSLSPEQLSVGVMSNLVIFPATFLSIWMFRKTRAKKKRASRIQEAINRKYEETKSSASVSEIDAEVRKEEELDISDNPTNPPPLIENGRPESPPDNHDGDRRIAMEDPLIKPRKKRFSLPWYCRIISWCILWFTVALGMTFSLFYGVQFGEEKAKKWITSMMIAFIMSVFITQPIKVFLFALFFSLVLKKTDDDEDDVEEDEEEPQLQYDEEWIHQPNGEGTFGVTRPRKIAYRPPNSDELEKFRDNRLKELKMYAILREILFYALFLWILLSISYSFRDPESYQLKEQMTKVFIKSKGTDYRTLSTFDGYWKWVKEILIPALIVDPWYDHETNFAQAYGQRGFISDRNQRHMGYAVIRQLRARPDSCRLEKVMKSIINECVSDYNIFDQEERTFGPGWTTYNATANNTREPYMYTEASALDGFPWFGILTVYSGGGYVARLFGSDSTLQEKVDKLINETWLDSYTRAIFVEFTTYNPNSNLFSVNTILTEFPGSTRMVNSFRFEPVNLLGDYHSNAIWYELTCQILFIVFLIYFLQREIKVLIKERMRYFKHLWNICEMAIIGISISSMGIYFYRLVVTKSLVATFAKTHGLAYVKFQYVASWNEVLSYLIGWLVFLANLKFLRLLRFNKRMSLLGSVLRQSRKDLFMFGIMFAIIFFAFVQFFYLLFLRTLEGYKSFIASAETSLNIMLGKFNFQAMLQASPVLAPFFFFLFVVTIIMILINMFLSILNETFTMVKADVSKQANDYEMVDFILRRFKAWTGIGNTPPVLPPMGGDDTLNNQKAVNGMNPAFEMQIDNFPDKVDKLLNTISKVYFDHDRIDALLDPSKMGASKETMKMMMKNQNYEKDNQARAAVFKNIHLPDVEDVEK